MAIKMEKDSLGYLFIKICKNRRNIANEMLAGFGIHAGQDVLLYYLSRKDGQTISELVKNICVQHATISNMISRMEANGLISKLKDDRDMRVSRIYLTGKGRTAMNKIEKVWDSLEQQTIEGFLPEEEKKLKKLLQQVLRNLDQKFSEDG